MQSVVAPQAFASRHDSDAANVAHRRGSERLRAGPGDQWGAGGQLRKPDIVEIAPADLLLPDSAGRAAHGAEAETFVILARRAETDDPDGHSQRGRTKAPRRLGATSRYASRSRSSRSSQATAPSSQTPTQPLGPTYGGTKKRWARPPPSSPGSFERPYTRLRRARHRDGSPNWRTWQTVCCVPERWARPRLRLRAPRAKRGRAYAVGSAGVAAPEAPGEKQKASARNLRYRWAVGHR